MEANVPESLDVMALPEITLFPGALLPLFIFEPRYREMVARSLASHRMFAVGHLQGEDDEADVYPVGGAGLIRACVTNADGTSHLILQGLARVRFTEWLDVHACRHAVATVVDSTLSDRGAATRWQGEILTLCKNLGAGNPELARLAESLSSGPRTPATFSDLVSATAVADAQVRQRLMEEVDVAQRLRIVAGYLRQRAEASQ